MDRVNLIKEKPYLKEIPFNNYLQAERKIVLSLDHHHEEIRMNAEEEGS